VARPLVVRPGPPLAGTLRPPGDKSVTHRAYILGMLAGGETVVRHPNDGEDCRATLRCVEALGADAAASGVVVRLRGAAGRLARPVGELDCGNSGTTLRLLAGVLAGQPFPATLTGDDSLRRRPMDRVVEALRAMGAAVSGRDGGRLPPLEIRGGPLRGTCFERVTPSAQVASAILLAGVQARGTTCVWTAPGARDHTARLLPRFGVAVESSRDRGRTRFAVAGPAKLAACEVVVPGDFSATACHLAAAAATPGARVEFVGVGLNPGRVVLLSVLRAMGARIDVRGVTELAGEPVGDLIVSGADRLRPVDIDPADVPALQDEVPAWTVAASAAPGISRLRGAAELRVKESDRLHALAEGLGVLGVRVDETPDGLDIQGGGAHGGTVRAYGDHRIAMAFAVLGTRASGPVTVDDAGCISTSYPAFVDDLRSLGGLVEEPPIAGGAGV